MSEVKLKVLHKFTTLHEANIAKSFLNSKGIDAQVFDEHTVNIYATPAIFSGVRVMVPSHQLEDAKKELSAQQDFASNNHLELVGTPCPSCNSTQTEITNINRKSIPWLIISYLLIFPALKASSVTWTCHNCNQSWKSKTDTPVSNAMSVVITVLTLALVFYFIFMNLQK